MIEIYLGTPPANVVSWYQKKYGPQYLTIEPLSSETPDADKTSITLKNDFSPALTGTFEAKLNDGAWTTVSWEDVTMNGTAYNLVKACNPEKETISYGEKLQIRGLDKWETALSLKVTCAGGAKVSGKLAESFTPEFAASAKSFKLESFFNGSTGLKDASELDLGGIALTDSCYYSMFSGCTSLVNAPKLPATTLADDCYSSMFSGCTSLVNAPALPAITLADGCYFNMFNGCTKITELHYPASIENDSTFTSMSGSPKFGATNATVAYDL